MLQWASNKQRELSPALAVLTKWSLLSHLYFKQSQAYLSEYFILVRAGRCLLFNLYLYVQPLSPYHCLKVELDFEKSLGLGSKRIQIAAILVLWHFYEIQPRSVWGRQDPLARFRGRIQLATKPATRSPTRAASSVHLGPFCPRLPLICRKTMKRAYLLTAGSPFSAMLLCPAPGIQR
jgi:hypothetical protein